MDESAPSEDEVKDDFTINSLRILAAQYKREGEITPGQRGAGEAGRRAVNQVPMSLNIPGVPSIRQASGSSEPEAYKVTEG